MTGKAGLVDHGRLGHQHGPRLPVAELQLADVAAGLGENRRRHHEEGQKSQDQTKVQNHESISRKRARDGEVWHGKSFASKERKFGLGLLYRPARETIHGLFSGKVGGQRSFTLLLRMILVHALTPGDILPMMTLVLVEK